MGLCPSKHWAATGRGAYLILLPRRQLHARGNGCSPDPSRPLRHRDHSVPNVQAALDACLRGTHFQVRGELRRVASGVGGSGDTWLGIPRPLEPDSSAHAVRCSGGLLKGKRDEGEVSLQCEGRAGSISGRCARPGHSRRLEPFWLLLVPSELLTDVSALLSSSPAVLASPSGLCASPLLSRLISNPRILLFHLSGGCSEALLRPAAVAGGTGRASPTPVQALNLADINF